jgi:hypothetical protein
MMTICYLGSGFVVEEFLLNVDPEGGVEGDDVVLDGFDGGDGGDVVV